MKTAFWKADWFFGLVIAITLFGFARVSGFIPGLERWAYDLGVKMTSKSPSDKIAVIAIDEQSITLRRSSPAGEHFSVFPRHGSKVKLHAPSTALHPSRLIIESRGQACEVGRFLTEDERRTLAARLKQLVGNV